MSLISKLARKIARAQNTATRPAPPTKPTGAGGPAGGRPVTSASGTRVSQVGVPQAGTAAGALPGPGRPRRGVVASKARANRGGYGATPANRARLRRRV